MQECQIANQDDLPADMPHLIIRHKTICPTNQRNSRKRLAAMCRVLAPGTRGQQQSHDEPQYMIHTCISNPLAKFMQEVWNFSHGLRACLNFPLLYLYSASFEPLSGLFSRHTSSRSPLRSSVHRKNILGNSTQNKAEQNLNRLLLQIYSGTKLALQKTPPNV